MLQQTELPEPPVIQITGQEMILAIMIFLTMATLIMAAWLVYRLRKQPGASHKWESKQTPNGKTHWEKRGLPVYKNPPPPPPPRQIPGWYIGKAPPPPPPQGRSANP